MKIFATLQKPPDDVEILTFEHRVMGRKGQPKTGPLTLEDHVNKDLRKLTRELVEQGFAVRSTRRGHLMVTFAGQSVAVLAGTPSDHRSNRNGLARLRRAGFVYNTTL